MAYVLRNNVKSRQIEISQQPNNRYCKLCVIPVINNDWIFLKIKILPPPSKGKLFLIHTCLFKNYHKCYTSKFDRRTPPIKFTTHPLDVHLWYTSEKVSCDSFWLWQSLPFHYLQHGSKVYLNILVLYHHY